MRSAELRDRYVSFFEEKEHLHLASAPIIPIDALGNEDRSTLFTSAGMQQFKPYFTGEATPPNRRITTVQKCVRTGDIDSVGDLSHCTFFEMLGNFSFGDYFKAEVIPWTWEFLTDRLGLDPDRLCVTVYLDDDEAFEIWRRSVGLPEERIHRLGGDKNYWPANAVTDGPNGPCGPCTEIFYRTAPEEHMTRDPGLTPTERFVVDDGAGRWLELWNNVFTQFNRTEDVPGEPRLDPLPAKNNDTGAGLERIVCVLQGVGSVFESDLFEPAIRRIEAISGHKYGGTMDPRDFAFRVVAEHTRTMAFCIADGVLPLNEGRGYVLRRIMRRAIRFGKTALGLGEPFLHEVAPAIIETMGGAYPELQERRAHILATARGEEERFRRTLDQGVQRFYDMAARVGQAGAARVLPGDEAFMLHDTYGFPLELTEELAIEAGMSVDREGFARAMEAQRRLSQETSGIDRDVFTSIGEALGEIQRSGLTTVFGGYDRLEAEGVRVHAIVVDGQLVDRVGPGRQAEILLDQTPFYAESGGQVGDTGWLTDDRGLDVVVEDTIQAAGVRLHRAVVRSGEIRVGAAVTAVVDGARRMAIRRNHTATHLLHAALRRTLGEHVHQKGSLVAPGRLRFDFTHTQPVTREELLQVEDAVNGSILADLAVVVEADVPLDEARRRGAMALFGEKYGSTVRVVEVPGVSAELCGGCHLERTSQIGQFKVTSETGVAAGVRRIEAVTGQGAWEHVKELEARLREAAIALGAPEKQLVAAAQRAAAQRAELEKQLQAARRSGAQADAAGWSEVAGVALGVIRSHQADAETLGALVDRLAADRGSAVVVAGGAENGRVLFVAKVSKDLTAKGVHAGNLIRELAQLAGGNGGGRPDFAQAGGRDPSRLDEALDAATRVVAAQLKGE